MKHLRRGTAWLAAALGAGLAFAGTADATTLQRQVDEVLRSAPAARQISPNQVQWPRAGVTLTLQQARGLGACPSGYACLWQDFDYNTRRVQFYRYGTYNLAAYGMPRFTHRGASSYYNRQTGGAKAILHADFDFNMVGHGNLYGALNDRGKSVTLRP